MTTSTSSNILKQVQQAAGKKILFLPHAVNQMNAPARMISPAEVRAVIENGKVIEDYPEDVRGHSCLLLGAGHQGRAIHLVCAPKLDYLAIITAYLPDPRKWSADFERRKDE